MSGCSATILSKGFFKRMPVACMDANSALVTSEPVMKLDKLLPETAEERLGQSQSL